MNIVFFDGVCNLCNSYINLLIKIDKNAQLKYSSLQGQLAQEKIDSNKIKHMDSIIYLSRGIIYEKSQAVIQILITLGGFYNVFGRILNLLPTSLLNIVYNFIAKNRYKLFGKKELCRIPNEEEKNIFID